MLHNLKKKGIMNTSWLFLCIKELCFGEKNCWRFSDSINIGSDNVLAAPNHYTTQFWLHGKIPINVTFNISWPQSCKTSPDINMFNTILFKPLAPGRCPNILQNSFFKCQFWQSYLIIFLWNWSGRNANILNSTLEQVMAWCRQQQAITWANVDQDHCCHMAPLG